MIALPESTSWQELETRLRPFVARRVATDADVDDILQEVLLRMHRGLSTLEDHTRLSAWMYRIARNAIVDHLRDRGRHPVLTSRAEELETVADEDEQTVSVQLAQYLAFLVALLPSPYREAITLTELEGKTHKEAAELLGISLSGMKSRVQRGRAKLRGMLDTCCEIALDARNRVIACEPRPSVAGACQCKDDK